MELIACNANDNRGCYNHVVALYTALKTAVALSGGHFRHLAKQKPLVRSMQNFVELIMITLVGPSILSKFIMIGQGVAAPCIGEVVVWRRFFQHFFLLGKRTTDAERSTPTYYISVDASWAKYEPLGGLINMSLLMRELPIKTPHFRDSNEDFRLKRLPAYLGTEETYHNALRLQLCISARHTVYERKYIEIGSLEGSNFQKFVTKAKLEPNSKHN
jgi:hypothetical protein